MRVLIVHNRYRQEGGEDFVFKAETNLLKEYGHEVQVIEFDNEGSFSPLKLIHNFDSVEVLSNKIRNFQPEIIHVHNLFLKASPAILTEAKKQKIPVVMTLHNYRLLCINGLLLRNGEVCEKCVKQNFPLSGITHSCYRDSKLASLGLATTTNIHRLKGTWKDCVQKYIALTVFGRDKILSGSLGLKPEQVVIKPNYLADSGKGLDKREGKFLFVGRLSEEKGIRTLLEAHKLGDFDLEIIGDGPLRDLVQEVSKTRENILYRGKRDRSYILNRMKSVRAVIVPSIWYEGLPTTIIESFSCGTPVIASKIGPMPELVMHEEDGLIFKMNDSKSLLEQIERLPTNEDWNVMSDKSRRTYLEKYTPKVNYNQLLNIYKHSIHEFSNKL